MDTTLADNLTSYLEDALARMSCAADRREADEARERFAAEMRERINVERLEAATRLAGWLAHRINNPLGAISGNAQLLARRLERDAGVESPEPYMKYVEAIRTQTERSAAITGELLEFTRPRDAAPRNVNVARAIEEAIELAQYSAGRRDLRIASSGADGLREVWTDKELLVRGLYEVIVNAIYAAGEGGSVRVTTRAADSGRRLRISVSDSGQGIAPEVLPRVFDPFFSTREKARGLGLTTALSIMRRLGGTVEITETGPSGTIVTIEAPTGRSGR